MKETDKILTGKRVSYGKVFVGWALSIPENQKWPRGGRGVAIHNETVDLDEDYEELFRPI